MEPPTQDSLVTDQQQPQHNHQQGQPREQQPLSGADQSQPTAPHPPAAVPQQAVPPVQDNTALPVRDAQAPGAAAAPSIQDQAAQSNGFMFQNPGPGFPTMDTSLNGNGLFPAMPNLGMPSNHPISASNGPTVPKPAANGHDMTADEIALYDRQIRLWGMQAQSKISGANVLLITMKALGNEIAKNLVLAGIGSLTIVDEHVVTEADLGAQFFLSQEDVGRNRAEAAAGEVQKLNPRVKVYPDSESIMTKGPSYFGSFDVVIATDLNPTLFAFINTATRLHNRKFYAAGTHGLYGYIFCDLIEHDYILKRDKGNVTTSSGPESRTRSVIEVKTQKEGNKVIELVSKRELYSTWDLASDTSALPAEYLKSKRRLMAVTPALSCLRALWAFQQAHERDPGHIKQDLELFTRSATQNHQYLSLPAETLRSDFLRSFLQNIGSELAPVAAILGGQLAQDVINVLGQNQQPIQNMVIFDGNRMEANMYSLHPEMNLGRAQLELATPMPMNQVDPTQMMPMDQTQLPSMGQGQMPSMDQSQMPPMNPTGNIMPTGNMHLTYLGLSCMGSIL
ncbi:hypothetical protein F4780DRAFT_782396 [Xylariomycetidae sp. FL0641]|nr:hypothetical protein F4780DRAFT_782396 [Xylariomycetidae sp. FL0641]